MTHTAAGYAISAQSREHVAPEDRRRLLTTKAYTDHALAAFVRGIERTPEASRSIFVVSADHATADQPLWGGETDEQCNGQGPIVHLFPLKTH